MQRSTYPKSSKPSILRRRNPIATYDCGSLTPCLKPGACAHQTVIRFVINEIDIVVTAVSAMLDFHEALYRLMPHRQSFEDIQKIRGFTTVISVVAANAALAGRVIEPDFVEQYGIVAAAEAAAAKCA